MQRLGSDLLRAMHENDQGWAHISNAAENLAAATQWRELAAKCEEAAAWEESIGCPYGDMSTYHYNAALYRQTAAQLEALYR